MLADWWCPFLNRPVVGFRETELDGCNWAYEDDGEVALFMIWNKINKNLK